MAENQGVSNVSNVTKDFFSPGFVSRLVEQNYISPNLIWNGLLTNQVGSTEKSFKKPMYMVDSSGNRITPQTSATMKSPVLHYKGTYIPKIGEDDYTFTTDATVPYALGFDVDEDMRANPGSELNKRTLADTMEKFGFAWARHINSEVLKQVYNSLSYTVDGSATLATYMDNSANMSYESTESWICGKLDAGTYWNTDGADYLTDMLNLKTAGMNQANGFFATFDTMAMSDTVVEDLILWGQTNGYSWEMSPVGNGRQIGEINGTRIMTLNNVDGFASTNFDKVLFWDSRVTPGTTVYYTGSEPDYSSGGGITRFARQDYGPDQGSRSVFLARADYKTFVNPTSEYFYGELEVY